MSDVVHKGLIIYAIILRKSVGLTVAVRKLQIAFLARSSREVSQTVRIDGHSFFSRVRISVRPSIVFISEKQPTNEQKNQCSVDWPCLALRPLARPLRCIHCEQNGDTSKRFPRGL